MGVDRFRGRVALAATVVAGLLVAVGCSPTARPHIPHEATEGGQTLAQMRSAIESIDGIRVLNLRGGGPPNIKQNTGYDLTIEIESGVRITDGAALVDFLVESIWSVREGYMPNAQIAIRVRAVDGYDVHVAAAEAGWVSAREADPSDYSRVAIVLSESKPEGAANRERLGPWPGEPPAIPAGITIRDGQE